MPTYEYKCKACSHQFEQFQSMKDAALTKCPECGKKQLERLIGTGGAIIFKGSGFYQTDYRSDSYKKSADADSKPAATPAADKPAAKSEAAPAKPAAKESSAPAKADAKPKKSSGNSSK